MRLLFPEFSHFCYVAFQQLTTIFNGTSVVLEWNDMNIVNFLTQLDLHGENETIVYIKINIFFFYLLLK